MDESILGFLADIASRYLVDPIERRLDYLFSQNKLVEKLRGVAEELNKEQARVQEYTNEAKRRDETQAINKDIEDWLTVANKILNDEQSLDQGRIEENKRCFPWCTNWVQRYQLSKKIDQRITVISILVWSSTFITSFLGSKSSNSAFNQIVEALKDDEVNMIAVWGMAGVGKTTLVKEVGKAAKSLQLFHKVIFVFVSLNPDVGKIQDHLADFLDLKFRSHVEKAEQLRNRLKKEENVLMILDNMWKKLDLEGIGIPLHKNGCKIILTTRFKQVCKDMESQVTVSVGLLEEDEAWTLFKMKSSLDNASPPEIINVAQKVAKECSGLPIAIVTIARALRSKDLREWELALNQLNGSGFEDDVCYSLKLSYDYLSSETKRCFLLHASYPKGYSLDVEDFVRCVWSLGILEDCMLIKDARDRGYEIIDSLKNSCLLSEDGKRCMKMHDVVRRAALRMASEEDNDFVIGLHDESSKQKLQILLLDNYDGDQTLIEGMPELKVLNLEAASLSRNTFFSLNALKSLANLRVLKLKGFKELGDISALANLAKLKILSIHDSEFKESVDKLGELENLIVLEIYQCNFLWSFPPNVIQRLVKLEELHLRYTPFGWLRVWTRKATISTSIPRELNSLSSLSSLLLEVPYLRDSEDFVFPKVKRYRIAINRYFISNPMAVSQNFLVISKRLPLNMISELLWEVEFLALYKIIESDIKFLTDGTTAAGNAQVVPILRNLKEVRIMNCRNLQVIFQTKAEEDYVLSNLKDLSLKLLPELEYIWKIPSQRIRLQSLEVVKIGACGKLKSLFSFSLAQYLVCLQLLKIDGCGELKQIVEELEGDEQEISPNSNALRLPELRSLEICNCDRLEYIFPEFMSTQGLPKLQKLSLGSLRELKQICRPAYQREENGNSRPEQQVLPSLKELTLSHCPRLTDAKIHSEPFRAYLKDLSLSNVPNQFCEDIIQLKGGYLTGLKKLMLEEIYELQGIWKDPSQILTLRNLSHLEVFECNKLKTIFTELMARNLPQLSYLKVQGCEALEQIVVQDQILPPSMASHKLARRKPVCFPNLEELCIVECNKLESLFPVSFSHLPKLKRLQVKGASELREIFGHDREVNMTNDEKLKKISLPGLEELILEDLPELLRFATEGYYFAFPALISLRVIECPSCRETIRFNFNDDKDPYVGAEIEDLCISNVPNQLCEGIIQLQCRYLTSLKKLMLEDMNELQVIWKDPRQALTLQNLSHLEVLGCNKLKTIFTAVIARNLPQLSYLKVQGCEALDQVVAQDQILPPTMVRRKLARRKLARRKPVCFPNLEEICIVECNKLESLFPVSFSHLPKLKRLQVKGASELREIFGHDSEANMTNDEKLEKISLPGMEELILKGLPKLLWFAAEGNSFAFPALIKLRVKKCPTIIMRYSVHDNSEGSYVRAELERSKVPEEVSTETDTDIIGTETDTDITLRQVIGCGEVCWDGPIKSRRSDHEVGE